MQPGPMAWIPRERKRTLVIPRERKRVAGSTTVVLTWMLDPATALRAAQDDRGRRAAGDGVAWDHPSGVIGPRWTLARAAWAASSPSGG